MKLLLIIPILFFTACKNENTGTTAYARPLNSKDTTITLKDTLGEITITIPDRYDTFISWTHISDCSGCGYEKYRFQPKSLPVFKESGWLWRERKDSIDELTIEHPQYIVIRDSIKATRINYLHGRMLNEAKSEPLTCFDKSRFDTIENINGNMFSIITAEHYDDSTKLYNKIVWAETFIKGNEVKFTFTLLTDKNDSSTTNFIKSSKKLLQQIRIKSHQNLQY